MPGGGEHESRAVLSLDGDGPHDISRLALVTVPLGGFFERYLARKMTMPETGLVLYLGLCGGGRGGLRDTVWQVTNV